MLSTTNERKKRTHDQYTLGWICALEVEQAASLNVFDEVHEEGFRVEGDGNTYTLGAIGCHNVVTCLPLKEPGTARAAFVAANMKRTFPWLVHIFIVGTAGGAPKPGQTESDIRLGDVVVGTRVVQYDLMKVKQQQIQRIIKTACPPVKVLRAIYCLRMESQPKSNTAREGIYTSTSHLPEKPPIDLLFEPQYEHSESSPDCGHCQDNRKVNRLPRLNPAPKVHFGTVASANIVMKYGSERDRICSDLSELGYPEILCFEMEAAGLIDALPFTAIRGISDYADSHKNDEWKEYASASAAAYAKELLAKVPKVEAGITKERSPTRITAMIDGKEYLLGTAYKGTIDPKSAVDVMKSFGLDSSQNGRRRYAKEYRISGNAGDPDWNMRIRHEVLKNYGVKKDS